MENSEVKDELGKDTEDFICKSTMEIVNSSEAKEVTSLTSVGSSPTSTTDFVYVDDTASNSSKKLRNSFTEVSDSLDDDYMPKMEQTNKDVCKLVSEAQMDVFIADYYTDEKDQEDNGCDSQPDLCSSPEVNEEIESPNTSDDEREMLTKNSSEGEANDACVLFHGITYLGASKINAPVSELELKGAISILRDHKESTIGVILSVSLSHTGSIRLLDPVSRAEIAKYGINNICFWGKGESESEDKDCLGFNIQQGKEEVIYHCHVFQCAEEDDVKRIIQSIAQTVKRDQKRKQQEFPGGRRGSRLDPNNLTFKFNIILDVWEEDGKGSYQQVARDRNHFKLKVELQRKLVFVIEQLNNKKMKIERCFGLLLAQGRDVKDEDLHLLQQVETEPRQSKTTVITGHWDPNLDFWKVLNTDPKKDTKVFMTVAADIVFEDLKEPVRFVKKAKVRVFPANEKFWNPTKPRIQEEFTLQLKETDTELQFSSTATVESFVDLLVEKK